MVARTGLDEPHPRVAEDHREDPPGSVGDGESGGAGADVPEPPLALWPSQASDEPRDADDGDEHPAERFAQDGQTGRGPGGERPPPGTVGLDEGQRARAGTGNRRR